MPFEYKKPIIGQIRSGKEDDPFILITNDVKKITNGYCKLDEIPNELNHVTITSVALPYDGEVYYKIFDKTKDIGRYEYRTDYVNGIVYFHEEAEGRIVTFSYYGRGCQFISAERIFTKESGGNVVETLQDMTNDANELITSLEGIDDRLNTIETKVDEMEISSVDAIARQGVAQLEQDVSGLSTTVGQHTARIGEIEDILENIEGVTIVDNLTSTSTTSALSANQGRVLNIALSNKVDKVAGKGLSTEDYTTVEKSKLATIAEGANNYTHPATHSITEVDGLQSALDDKANATHQHSKTDISDFPTLATVATSGNYSDLSGKPSIPTVNDTLTSTSTTSALSANQGRVLNIALSNKVDKVAGKGLSTNDYTNIDKAEVSKIVNKADISYVNAQISAIGDGSPKGVYATLTDLQNAYPTGTTGIYIVTADGKWYYWNDSAWTAGGTYQSTAIANDSVTAPKVSALAYGKPFILPALTLPNFDTATKTLSFNSDETYKCMLFYKNTKYDIPVGTTVVDGNTTSAVQLVFDTTTSTFSFIGHATVPSETQIRVGVFKRRDGFYQWDFPCAITVDGILSDSYKTSHAKWANSFAFISHANYAKFQKVGSSLYFALSNDSAYIAIRPNNADNSYYYSITWSDMKTLFSDRIVTYDGYDYIQIADSESLIYNYITNTVEIIRTVYLRPFVNVLLLASYGGYVKGGWALYWENEYKHRLIDDQLSAIGLLPSYILEDLESVNNIVSEITSYDTLTFGFITDIHGYLTHVDTIAEMSKYGQMDFVVCAGDTLAYEKSIEETRLELSNLSKRTSSIKEPIFFLRGNHDSDSDGLLTVDEWFNRLIKPCRQNNIVVDSVNPQGGYYYQDFDKFKIRVIFTNSTNLPVNDDVQPTDTHYRWGFSSSELQWIGDVALDFTDKGDDKSNWSVVVLGHHNTRVGYLNDSPARNGDILEQILKAFKNGTAYSDVTTGINVDFTSQGAMSLIGYIFGHSHVDAMNVPVDLGFPLIAVICSNPQYNDSPLDGTYSYPRTIGTDTEYAWDIFVVDTSMRTITIKRVGAGEDRSIEY